MELVLRFLENVSMDNIIVITQNVVLESLGKLKSEVVPGSILVVSTQFIFGNEATLIDQIFGVQCMYMNFSDLLSDKDLDYCDTKAYSDSQKSVGDYYCKIKEIKNKLVIEKLESDFHSENRIIVCDDLGIDINSWLHSGYRKVECCYYHVAEVSQCNSAFTKFLYMFKCQWHFIVKSMQADIWKTKFNGVKYLFHGSLNRIGYRIDLKFSKASKWENIKYIINKYSAQFLNYFPKNNVIRMSTLHESVQWHIPDHPNANKKLIQDGYLPPNYPSKYLLFNGKYTEYYTWDVLGQLIFKYHKLPSRPMPFRKKLYLPDPIFPKQVKKILCVASGAGDWTAVKNRSDEDKMIFAFGKIAAIFPDIEFIYRCHPVWVHPQHQGVNSIVRAAKYIDYLNLPNFRISCNIPSATDNKGHFILSYKRTSFDDDLKDVDIVFGEHSVSMIDAAFKSILFCSVNVTGRRDFFEGVTNLGFPHCESIDEIAALIRNVITNEFQLGYEKAIHNYNEMTDKDM